MRTGYPNNPHPARPFRIVGGNIAVHEQDGSNEVLDCAVTVLRTEVGTILHAPGFGIRSPVLKNNPDYEAISKALRSCEPRMSNSITSTKDSLDSLIERVAVNAEVLS